MKIRDFMNIIMEATTVPQAYAVFRQYGRPVEGYNADQIQKIFRGLAAKYHPDVEGGNEEIFAKISDANDILQKLLKNGGSRSFYGEEPPANNTADYANTDNQNFHHLRYFQEKMDELSRGKPGRAKFSVMNFDGHFFRGSITVWGCPSIFPEIVKAMKIWNRFYNCRAIFVYSESYMRDNEIELIYLDGKMIPDHPPIILEHDSFNLNPSNDQHFMRELPDILDRIGDKNA